MFQDGDIVITSDKNRILNDNKKLLNIKLYTINEFNKLIYFDYDIDTVYYVMKKYNVIYDIAKIYLDNLLYIEDKKYKSKKLNFLNTLKKDLLDNKLLKENKLFREYIKNKRIVFFELDNIKEINKLKKVLEEYSEVVVINSANTTYVKNIIELNSIEDEVVFVANKICELCKKGVSFTKMYITNIDEEYKKIIRRVFPMFNINISLNIDDSILGTRLVNIFLDNYRDNIEETLSKVLEYVNTEEDNNIYNQILNIVNKYIVINKEDRLEFIKREFKNTKIKNKQEDNSIREIRFNEINDVDGYVFLMGFNQGIIPSIYKDEYYLSDKDREELGISLIVDKNSIERNRCIDLINSVENLIITYKLNSNGEEFKVSNINEELNYEVIINNKIERIYSNSYNKIYLTNLKDLYNKYGVVGEELNLLDKYYSELPYNTYDNKYTGIDKILLRNRLDNKISLSYSSLDKYYRCPFGYYLDKVLNLNIYEESFYQEIGNLFHGILQKYFDKQGTYNELWNEGVNSLQKEFSSKEKFFLDKLKEELSFVIETIEYQETLTDLHEELHEEKIYQSISGDINITFTGIVDKIKYKEVDDYTILALIDYKTGRADIDLSLLPYGIGLQLPVYIYLARNNKRFKNVKVAGFYLQKILNNEESNNDDKNYLEMKRKNLLLQGYSNESVSILGYMDNTYEDSSLIKSMKVKKDGNFSSYAKVLSDKQMDIIERIVINKIQEGANSIANAQFEIAPKSVENKNISCSRCRFKDICFVKNEDIMDLKKLKEEDIFGGDDNGLD